MGGSHASEGKKTPLGFSDPKIREKAIATREKNRRVEVVRETKETTNHQRSLAKAFWRRLEKRVGEIEEELFSLLHGAGKEDVPRIALMNKLLDKLGANLVESVKQGKVGPGAVNIIFGGGPKEQPVFNVEFAPEKGEGEGNG